MVTANFVISEDEFDVLYTLAGLYGDDLGYVKEYEVEIYARDLGAIQPVDDPLVPGDEYYVATQRNNYLVAIEMLKRVKQRNRVDAAIYQEQINDLSFKLDLMDDGPTTSTPSGEGINIAEVDARVRRLVDDWAEAGNTDLIPRDKIPDELPPFPAEGQRDNKVPKFDGNALNWEVDSGDTGGAVDQTARDAATNAQETADANKMAIDTLESTGTEVSGAIGVVPKNIDAIADIDGDYILAVNDLNIEYLNSKNVDQYEIWVKEESIHTSTGTWTPVSDFQVPFNVSTTEETGIGLVGTDRIVPIRLVFRASGTFVDWVATYLTIGDGGGSGDVTAEQLKAEADLRSDGDNLQTETLTRAADLFTFLPDQLLSDSPATLLTEVDVEAVYGGEDHRYGAGDLIYFPPKSITGKVMCNVYNELPIITDSVATEAEWNARVNRHTAETNVLFLRVSKRLFSTIAGSRRAREVGELYRLNKNSNRAWFITDTTTTEEVNAIVNTAITNSVAFWARSAPGNVVNGQRAYPLPADLAPTPAKDQYLANDGNKNVWRAVSGGTPADGSITTAKLADRAVTGDKLARNTVAGDNLTPRVQTALLQMRTDPVRESASGAYTIAFGDAGLLGGSLFIQIRMNGRLVGAREAWTQQATLTRTPNAADLIEINRVSTTSVIITADWYSQLSGGNLVAGANYEVAIVPAVSDWALEGDTSDIPAAKLTNVGTIASPALVVTNIASFDGTQNRFEDSSGNEVTIPNGALVFLTQAIYDAAVADAQFTPNANAVFFTSS